MSLKGKMNAWIKPSGQFIAIGYMQHNEWASDYFTEKYGFLEGMEKIEEICKSDLSSYPYSALHILGWIRLLTWAEGNSNALGDCHNPSITDDTVDPSMTKKQKGTMIEWCKDNNYPYLKLFSDK